MGLTGVAGGALQTHATFAGEGGEASQLTWPALVNEPAVDLVGIDAVVRAGAATCAVLNEHGELLQVGTTAKLFSQAQPLDAAALVIGRSANEHRCSCSGAINPQ